MEQSLVIKILNYLDNHSIGQCALVCKEWKKMWDNAIKYVSIKIINEKVLYFACLSGNSLSISTMDISCGWIAKKFDYVYGTSLAMAYNHPEVIIELIKQKLVNPSDFLYYFSSTNLPF